jgi:CHAT domain-containing protein/Tfp pilus assembly protein PilF
MRKLLLALIMLAGFTQTPYSQEPPKYTAEQQAKLKERTELGREVLAMLKARKYAEAIPLYQAMLRLTREVLGEDHEDIYYALMRIAQLRERTDDFAAAEKVWEEQRVWCARIYGPTNWKTVDARIAAELAGIMAKLTPEQKKELAVADKLAGESIALYREERYAEAIEKAKQALAIRRRLLGEKNTVTASSWSNIGEMFKRKGEFSKAEPFIATAMSINKEAMGEEHPEYAVNLENMAGLLDELGRSADAEAMFLTSLRIIRKTLGEKNVQYARTLNNLALVYTHRSQYAKAEPLSVEAVRVTKAVRGEKHADYATCLNNLGRLYDSMGLYDKAEPLLLEALRIYKEGAGEKTSAYAGSLNNLALHYWKQESYEKAAQLLKEAVPRFKEILGEKHPDYATGLNNLALVFESQGKLAEAEPIFREVLRIVEGTQGKRYPLYALTLSNLGRMYVEQKKFAAAEPLLLEALSIRKETLGERHLDYVTSMNNLAHLYIKSIQLQKGEPLIQKTISLAQEHLEESAAVESEADQMRHVAASYAYLSNYLLMSIPMGTDGVYNAFFRWRGAVTARQSFARAAARSSPEVRKIIEELRDVARQLNNLSQNPPAEVPKQELARAAKALHDRREELEKSLANQSKDFAEYQAHRKITAADLQKSLPEGTALVDFFTHDDHLWAFVVTKTEIVICLEPVGRELNEEVSTFLGDLSLGRTRPVTHKDDISAKLRKKVWLPVEAHLKGINRVLICPDGPLCRLPFAALPGADPTKYLLEELSIVVVPVPQLLPGLLARAEKKPESAASLLVVGDVDFFGDPAAGEPPGKPLPVALTRGNGGLNWNPLPHSKGEAEAIETLFGKLPNAKVKKLTGQDATEAALEREFVKHRFIHLATHGFFLPPKFVRQLQDGGEKVLIPTVPPGLSSGIVCAGANKPTFQSSGILSATQIAELDLSGVELAVLSACETGLGELAGGEGALGLQRAFQIAGARSSITSLWSVPDQATAEMMKRMYSNRLEKGLAAAEALREAQLWVLNNGEKVGAFDQKPTGSKRTPPKFWAAFSLSGDWR